jgi:hypothetical protein
MMRRVDVGKYDKQIERSRKMLAEAQEKYSDSIVKMANAVPHVRQSVLDVHLAEIEEAESMIATFESANDD